MARAADTAAATGSPLGRWLPGVQLVRTYRRSWLRHDVAAGLALTGILVPAGMAYAEASGLPAITGLYATILPLLAYALVGPSRILILGPDSALVPLVVAALAPFAALGPEAAVEEAALLALLVALLVAAGGLLRFGFITDLLSLPVRVGYLSGIALVIFVGQLPTLFGFHVEGDGPIVTFARFLEGVRDGRTLPSALAIGLGCLATILLLRRGAPRVPGVLVAVVGATIVSAVLDLAVTTGLEVIGPLPQGLPLPSLPPVDPEAVASLLPAAAGIALVTAADTVILSRGFAGRHGYRADPDRELIALGAANAASGLFGGYPISSSASRTAVAEASGIRTQLAGVVGAMTIAVLLVVAPALLEDLPRAALAAVVLAAAIGLADPRAFVRLWQHRPGELGFAVVTFLGVALLGVIQGIFLAVVLSLLSFLRRAWWPHEAVLGRAAGVKGYHDLTYYPDARSIPGLVLFRFDAPLLFFNADTFRERVLAVVARADPPARWVVIAAEPITDVDTTAAEALDELIRELGAVGVTLAFAELKDPVKDRLRRYGSLERIGERNCFPTIGTAVDGYLAATGADWVDWEEAAEGVATPGTPRVPGRP